MKRPGTCRSVRSLGLDDRRQRLIVAQMNVFHIAIGRPKVQFACVRRGIVRICRYVRCTARLDKRHIE